MRDEATIKEINALWLPIYSYMADYLLAISDLGGGRLLDLGPFAGGVAVSVLQKAETFSATVMDESEAVLQWAEEQALAAGCLSRLATRRASIDLIPEADGTFDLVMVRGAFFFLTPSLLSEVRRVLKPGGFGWVGGGYGSTTPPEVIAPIAERSRVLNEALGKRRVTPEDARAMAVEAGVADCTKVTTEGGLWLEIRA